MAMADSPDPETRRFQAVRATPETVGTATASVVPAKRSNSGGVLGLVLILVAIIVCASILLINSLAGSNDSSDTAAPASSADTAPETTKTDTVLSTSPQETKPSAPPNKTGETPIARPPQPVLPTGAAPANAAAAAHADAGNLNNVYTGSAATSAEFAQAVRDAVALNYLENDEISGQVTAHSPITGASYSMNCQDNGDYVTCTGGNNAVVYIS